jgi:hypothetical protein
VKRLPMHPAARFLPVLAALLAACPALAQAGVAGRFQFVYGEVRVVGADGRERPAKKGDEISEGETLVSGATGSAQLRMVDDGIIAVRPDTRMRIDTFRYDGKEDGTEKSLLSLVKGGFRAITGAIGHINKQNYQIKTPAATIGIRGTDHEPVHIPPPAPGETPMGEPGTYEKVNVGQAVLETAQGSLLLGTNQVGYVATRNDRPATLPQVPGFYRAQPPSPGAQKPANGSTADETAATRLASAPPAGTTGTGSTGSGVDMLPPFPTPPVVQNETSGNFSFTDPVGTAGPAPIGFAGFGADLYAGPCGGGGGCGGAGGLLIDGTPGKAIYLDANQALVSVTDNTGTNAFQYNAGSATLLGYGSTSIGGAKVAWGRYEGADSVIDHGVLRDPTVFHFIGASSYMPADTPFAANVTAAYNKVVGYSVSNNLGQTGTLSASVTADFTNHTITNYSLTVDVPNAAGTVTGSGSFADFYSNGIPLGNPAGGTLSGKAYGAFVGSYDSTTPPTGVISSFGLTNSSNGTTVGGVFAATR